MRNVIRGQIAIQSVTLLVFVFVITKRIIFLYLKFFYSTIWSGTIALPVSWTILVQTPLISGNQVSSSGAGDNPIRI